MKYYIAADPHGCTEKLKAALAAQGFFEEEQPHKLILCGDLFDRGQEAKSMEAFVLELMDQDRVILIRGNHEDLAMDLLNGWHRKSWLANHHNLNGTVDTVCQLTGYSRRELLTSPEMVGRAFLKTPLIQKILPEMLNYYETEHYVFVHGWIPCLSQSVAPGEKEYVPIPLWRGSEPELWKRARWINGMEAAHHGILEPGKTIVCGHWHCSFGHCHYENKGGEFDNSPDFSPYYGPGIIALDACTAATGKVNCIVIED